MLFESPAPTKTQKTIMLVAIKYLGSKCRSDLLKPIYRNSLSAD